MSPATPDAQLDAQTPGRAVDPSDEGAALAGSRGQLRAIVNGPAFAVQFLTIVPPVIRRPPRDGELGAAEPYFPAVGLVLGLALAGLDLAVAGAVAPMVRDVLLVIALAGATGALHLDGLVDTFDGVFAPGGPERRLAIMRDPQAGTFGVVAVALLLILKVAALGALNPELRTPGLILAPCLGRWAIVLATWLFPYGRKVGLGRGFKDDITSVHALLAGASAALVAGWLGAGFGVVVFAGVSLGVLALGTWMAARLGGLTGDTYGALCELTEVGVWLAFGLRLGMVGA